MEVRKPPGRVAHDKTGGMNGGPGWGKGWIDVADGDWWASNPERLLV